METLNNIHSWTASILRGTRGLFADAATRQPVQTLEIYEFEGCPFCRKVREVVSELDLEYISRTSGRGSAKRDALRGRAGKEQFPYLIDPNTGTEMYESEAIIDYLCDTYGNGRSGWSRSTAPLHTLGASLATAVRPSGGRARKPRAEQPEHLLVLFNFEASPYCRKVREAMIELDLDYHVRNVAKRSARRPELVEQGGRMMVPYLLDPNTQTALYESTDIVNYLHTTYGGA